MPLALHDALVRSTPISPGPAPVPVTEVTAYGLEASAWFPLAIIATSTVDGSSRILRVETPSPARNNTFRQAWIGEVERLVPGSGAIFPDLGTAQDFAERLLEKLWTGAAKPPDPKTGRWNTFPGKRWNSVELQTWQDPIPGLLRDDAGIQALDFDGTHTWELP